LAACLLTAASASAHHSFLAEFDQRSPVTLEGTVKKVDWVNPHARFDIEVKDENGRIARWALETGSPGALMLRGWTRNTVKPGDHIKVYGYQARDKSSLAAARSVLLKDGRKFFGGQMDDGGPEK